MLFVIKPSFWRKGAPVAPTQSAAVPLNPTLQVIVEVAAEHQAVAWDACRRQMDKALLLAVRFADGQPHTTCIHILTENGVSTARAVMLAEVENVSAALAEFTGRFGPEVQAARVSVG